MFPFTFLNFYYCINIAIIATNTTNVTASTTSYYQLLIAAGGPYITTLKIILLILQYRSTTAAATVSPTNEIHICIANTTITISPNTVSTTTTYNTELLCYCFLFYY